MKSLIALCLVLGGCASKPKPMWEWCIDNPRRIISCEEFKSKLIDQKEIRSFQHDVGVYAPRVKVVK